MPSKHDSHKGMVPLEREVGGRERLRRAGQPCAARDGFLGSLGAADDLCKAAGMSLDDLALVAVKSPATMTDNDRALKTSVRSP